MADMFSTGLSQRKKKRVNVLLNFEFTFINLVTKILKSGHVNRYLYMSATSKDLA